MAEILTEGRSEALSAFAERWIAQLVARDGFERGVESYVERTFASFLRDDRTFSDILPTGLSRSIEHALADYLPIAVHKLGGIIDDPEARVRLQRVIHEIFEHFLRDLRFHQRLVARLVVTDNTLDRVLTTIEEEGAEQLAVMLRDPAVQDAIAGRINEVVADFLARPVTAVLGRPGEDSVLRAREIVSGWILAMARDPYTREFAAEKLGQGMAKAAQGTWGELWGDIPHERLCQAIVGAARSAPARDAYQELLGRAVAGVLDRPVGRPADLLPEGAIPRIQAALAEPLWQGLQTQSQHLVRMLDVGRRVEEKVRSYPTPKVEELVRRVTDRELRLIVQLGYVLGAVIGGVQVLVNALLP
jgi:hypothetical protein